MRHSNNIGRLFFASLIITIPLLLLSVLYVGSYLALVQPLSLASSSTDRLGDPNYRVAFYRCEWSGASSFFRPLENLDRRIRPERWQRGKASQSPLD